MGLLPGGEDVRGTLVLHSRYSYLGGGGRAVEAEFSFSSRCAVAQRFLLVSVGRAGQP